MAPAANDLSTPLKTGNYAGQIDAGDSFRAKATLSNTTETQIRHKRSAPSAGRNLADCFVQCDANRGGKVERTYLRVGHGNRQTAFPVIAQQRFRQPAR